MQHLLTLLSLLRATSHLHQILRHPPPSPTPLRNNSLAFPPVLTPPFPTSLAFPDRVLPLMDSAHNQRSHLRPVSLHPRRMSIDTRASAQHPGNVIPLLLVVRSRTQTVAETHHLPLNNLILAHHSTRRRQTTKVMTSRKKLLGNLPEEESI